LEILLTNDDSIDSPLLELAIDFLKPLGNLMVVVPKEEQSWKGKSITRLSEVVSSPQTIHGVEGCSFSGTPADCTNFAIYNLYGSGKPDLVVSGINIGANTGVSFTWSSGTVGACLEANIAQVPAVALSQVVDAEIFSGWADNRVIPAEPMNRLRVQTHRLMGMTFDTLMKRDDWLKEPVTWNVNMPFALAENCQLISSFLGHAFYGSIFKKRGDIYVHDVDSPVPDESEQADTAVVMSGHVSITRLDLLSFGQRTEDL
jgi:5'-nucleotidase